jgi:hypothetical protein
MKWNHWSLCARINRSRSRRQSSLQAIQFGELVVVVPGKMRTAVNVPEALRSVKHESTPVIHRCVAARRSLGGRAEQGFDAEQGEAFLHIT